jgi:hypothetical protein
MGNEEKSQNNSFQDPPEFILRDPIYKEALAKEWASYVFQQRLIHRDNYQSQRGDFQNSSMEIIKEASTNAGKALIILNGAAAIAILAKLSPELNLTKPLQIYSCGAATGALLFAGTYLSQHFYRFHKDSIGKKFHYASILAFIAGFTLFTVGSFSAATVLIEKNPIQSLAEKSPTKKSKTSETSVEISPYLGKYTDLLLKKHLAASKEKE